MSRTTITTHLIEWGSLLLLISLIIAPLLILGWLALLTDTLHVKAITVVDARDHTIASIEEKTTSLLGKNILFLQTPVLEHQIISSLPQIRDVYITRKLPNVVKIIVQEKTPALLLLSNATYFFVDGQGIAYERARLETLPGTVLPIIKNDDENARLEIGQPAIELAFVEFILEAQEQIPAIAGGNIAEMRIPSLSAREVHVLLDNNWLIRFDTTRSIEVQLGVLQRLLAHTIAEEDKEKIDYIDLRIPNRVYYKLHGVVQQPAT